MKKAGGGLKPVKRKDPRMYSFPATFGTATEQNINLRQEFSFDLPVFPDQNADGSPNGCTSYLVSGIASDEDKVYYDDPRYVYEKTKQMAHVQGEVPVDMETAFQAGSRYGVKSRQMTKDQALQHLRAPYFIIKKLNGSYYDGIVSAMLLKQGSVGVGTPWLDIFHQVGSDGIVHGEVDKNMDFQNGHAWEIVGQKYINGEWRLIGKSWEGPNVGDYGYKYFNKAQIDNLLSIRGSIALAQKDASPEDIRTVQLGIMHSIVFYFFQMLVIIKQRMTV